MLNYREDQKKKGIWKILEIMKKNFYLILVITLIILGIGGYLLTLEKSDDKVKSETKENIAFTKARDIELPIYYRKSYNPLTNDSLDISNLNALLFRNLFTLDDTLNIKGDLVKEYKVDTKNSSVDLVLKENKFSTGREISSKDISYTVDTIKSIGKDSMHFDSVNSIKNVDILGEKSLRINFKKKTNASLDNLIFPIVSKSDYDKKQRFSVGSGSYQLDKVIEGDGFVLKKNINNLTDKDSNSSENLNEQKASSDKAPNSTINYRYIKSLDSSLNLMTMNGITAMVYPKLNSKSLAKDKGVNYKPFTTSKLTYLGFNLKNKYLKDENIRRAISMIIDRKDIVKDDFNSEAKIPESLYYPNFLNSKGKATKYRLEFNPDKSEKLFQKSGIRDEDKDGKYEDKKGKNIKLKMITSTSKEVKDTASDIKEMLENKGIEIDIKNLSSKDFESEIKKGDFDLYVDQYKVWEGFNFTWLYAKGNPARVRDKKLLNLVNSLESTLDSKEQSEKFLEVKEATNKKLAYFPICYRNDAFLTNKALEYKVKPAFWSYYRGIGTWKLK